MSPLPAVVYDAGALVAADRRDRTLWRYHNRLLAREAFAVVPAPVLVQVWRDGARQANLARLLKGVHLLPLDGGTARAAGQLCGAASTSDVTDAVVAVVAAATATVVVTSDPDDLAHLLSHTTGGHRVELVIV